MTDGNNPYASQTATNTGDFDKNLNADYGAVKADFGSLNGYAVNMLKAAMDLMKDASSIYQIPQLSAAAFVNDAGPVPFAEGPVANVYVTTNFKDLIAMLSDLQVGLMAVANAAQTISDAYHLTDGSSSADLNKITVDAVDFAFAMGGTRPAGLPANIGTTIRDQQQQQYTEANNNLAAVTNATDPRQMGGTLNVSYEGGVGGEPTTKVTTISYPDGSSIQIEETTAWDGTVYTDYSALDASGKTTTANRQITSTAGGKTTVTYQQPDANGTYQTTHTETTTTASQPDGTRVTTTSSASASGGQSSTTTKTVNPDGSTETTTVQQTPDGTKTTSQAVGSNSDDVSDQKSYDPKKYADGAYTKGYEHRTMQ